jgi:hypothetical protein
VDLKDATLMFLAEAAGYPAVADLAQSAYDRLTDSADVDWRVLSDLVGEASGTGVLRSIRRTHGPAAFDAIVGPVLDEIGRRAPIRSDRYTYAWQPGDDPLTARLPHQA